MSRKMKTKTAVLLGLVGLALVAGAVQPSGNVNLIPADGETIVGGAFPNGTIDVNAGTVTMTDSSDEVRLGDYVDPALTNIAQLTFWVDASINCVINQDGAVVRWVDRRVSRDESGTFGAEYDKYKSGLVYRPEEGSTDVGGLPPTFKTDSRFPGKKFLDFGDYGSGRWMYLANNQTDEILHQRTTTWYCVVGFDTPNNSGHILSDISNLEAKGTGKVYFHKEYGGQAGGNISTTTADSCMYNGETRLDGVRINPTTTHYKWDDFQVLGQIGPSSQVKSDGAESEPKFSTLFNDRNIVFEGSDSGYRQGGGVLGELLTWNRVLTESERRQVEAYLFAKWFARPTGGAASIASGAKLVIAAGTSPVALDSTQGDGTLVKQGSGTLTLDRNRAQTEAKLRIEEGAVILAGSRLETAIEPVSGKKLTVQNGVLTASAAAKADDAELVGTGEDVVAVDPADLTAKTLRLQAMEVTLTPHDTAALVNPSTLQELYPNLLANASFETPVQKDKGYAESYKNNISNSWTSSSQVNAATYQSPWFGSDKAGNAVSNTIPDGSQYAAIQGKTDIGTLSQTFAAPVRGLYRMTFYMTRRTNRSEKPGDLIAKMSLDGTEFFVSPVYQDYRGDINTFKQYSAVLPPLTKASHTLTITVDSNVTTDRALVIDDIKIFPLAEGEYVYIPNSGFDSATTAVPETASNGWFVGAPAGTGWTGFAPDPASANWGVTRGRSTWFVDFYSTDKLADYSKVYLQRGAFISTSVEVPRDGRVRFSFVYSNRARYNWADKALNLASVERASGHSLVAYLDDQIMARVNPVTGIESRIGYGALDVTAGTHTLTISNELNAVTADVSSIVDEIRMVYVDSEPDIVPLTAFTDATNYWTMAGGVFTPIRNVATGRQVLDMGRGTGAERLINVPSNGYYQVVASFAGRAMDFGSANGPYNSYKFYPAMARVMIGGKSVLMAQMQDDTFREYRTVVYLNGGEQQVLAQCLMDGSAQSSSVRLGDLQILPCAAPTLAGAAATETRLALDGSSRLRLDYEGTLKVGGLKVNGKSYTGLVDAVTLPDVISGTGKINAESCGCVILFR